MAKITLIDNMLKQQSEMADDAAFAKEPDAQKNHKMAAYPHSQLNQEADYGAYNYDQAEDVALDKMARSERANHVMASTRLHDKYRRGRGAALNPKGRFESYSTQVVTDDWTEEPEKLKTEVQKETPRYIISRNKSPDIPFDQSINPYRGCEHGCIYCYARPTHSYMGLSAGLDFESRLFAKPQAAELLLRELSHPNYQPKTIALGSNTDPYQPIEKQYRITRSILETLNEARHPTAITTKSALILRDSDILKAMADENLLHVTISIESLDSKLIRLMDPRAATPNRRLGAVEALAKLGVPVCVLVAPVIPALNDHEVERILQEAANVGAVQAGYELLRLPHEVAPLFKDWLLHEYPDKYRRVLSQLRSMRGGKDNEYKSLKRMYGEGVLATLLARRFAVALTKTGLNKQTIRLAKWHFNIPEKWLGEPSLLHPLANEAKGTQSTRRTNTSQKGEKKHCQKKTVQLSLF